MQRLKDKIKLYKFYNHYCDAIACALGEFVSLDEDNIAFENALTEEEIACLVDYAVVKNKLAGVGKVNIKVPHFSQGVRSLEKFGLEGCEIVSAKNFASMPANALVGGRVILDIESLLEYNQELLSAISDFSARADVPLCISVGSKLEEVGKIVNLFKLSPVETLESFGFLDRQCFIYGLNYIDKDDQKLIKDYDKLCVFSPQQDGEKGRGAINLYNFIYNRLKFGFSSGQCYNIDMLLEGRLAKFNTNNLMHSSDLVSEEALIQALSFEEGEELTLPLLDEQRLEVLFAKKVELEEVENELLSKVKQIAKKIKENF